MLHEMKFPDVNKQGKSQLTTNVFNEDNIVNNVQAFGTIFFRFVK